MKVRSALVIVSVIGMSLGIATPKAGAAFHLMKVREVYAGGSVLNPSSEFVELQMYSPNQTQLTGHSVVVYDAAGSAITGGTFAFTGPIANGQTQRTILVATTQAETEFGVQADLEMSAAVIPSGGGKVCFDPEPSPIDCVAWGEYTGSQTNTGPPVNPSAGIPAGQSIERKITPGCATLLEAADDTGNSANDFQSSSPSPRPNSVTPTETECGGGGTDTEKPQSEIRKPEHRSTVARLKKISGTAEDVGGSGVAMIEIALRQKVKGGCTWWNGDSFVKGSCMIRPRIFLEGNLSREKPQNWSYKVTVANFERTFYGRYTLYSRATDVAGNVETDWEAGRNVSSFKVAESDSPRPQDR